MRLADSAALFALISLPFAAKADTITYNDVTGFSSANGIGETLTMTAGQAVKFGVAPIGTTPGSYNYDSTGLALTVTTTAATPEPSSMSLLGTGLLAVASLAHRKFRKV